MTIPFPQRLSLAQGPTPLQPLLRLSEQFGVNIWIKRDDLTGCAASGNKIRKLEFSLGAAKAAGADTIITCGGLQSNHCRATAILAARLGLKCHLVLRGPQPEHSEGNLLLDQLVGAEIHYHPIVREYHEHLPEILQRVATTVADGGGKPFVIPTGASDEIGVWGYVAGYEELRNAWNEAAFTPDAIVHATGSGGTQAGLIAGQWFFDEQAIPVWGVNVCDDREYFVNKITEDLHRWSGRYEVPDRLSADQINILEGYMGPGYGRTYPQLLDTIRNVARQEGVILDPVYTGKGFHGMLQEIKSGIFSGMDNIVFIHTGGIFGLFPYKETIFSYR